MKRLLSLLLLLCTSCSAFSPHLPALGHYDLWLDPSCGDQTRAAVAEGVKQWTEFTTVTFTMHEGSEVCLLEGCFSIHETDQASLDKWTGHDYVGLTEWGLIFIASGKSWDKTQDTAIHEIGHALGLLHHNAPAYAVMNSTYGEGADHVACDDVAQFYSVRDEAVPTSGISPCTDAPGPLDAPPGN